MSEVKSEIKATTGVAKVVVPEFDQYINVVLTMRQVYNDRSS